MIIHAAACVAGCYFAFFGLVAAQGILLNLLRPPLFARVTGYLQGVVVALMLILIVLSFSIQAQVTNTVLQPGLARWVPPVWFLGFHQTMLGDPDPAMRVLAHRAAAGLITAVVLALLTYLLSYRRHRVLLIEGMTPAAKDRRWNSAILDWIIRDPRERAVMAFMAKTLSASSQHRTILMGYVGFGVAIVLSGVIGMQGLVESAKVLPACFVYTHVIVLVFLLIGLRHLFSLPIEFSANWTFQITEREGRIEWLYAMDRFVLVVGGALLLAVPFPIEVKLLGWRGVQESVLFAAFGLFCYECVFYSWQKLPFTCSHLPGKTPVWIVTLKLFALLWLLPVACWLLLACLYKALAFIIVVPALITAWIRVRASRRDGWYDLRLQYEEAPEPAVHALDLLK